MADESASLVVVIVNWRTAALTIDCLRSLAPEVASCDATVIVADNASDDGSAVLIGDAITELGFDSWATLMSLPRNGGFSYGNNAALRVVLAREQPPDLVLLLNPDTTVKPGALSALVDFMHQHPEAGIAGSRIENPDGTTRRSAFRFHTVAGEFDAAVRLRLVSRLMPSKIIAPEPQHQDHETQWVSGAAMIVRREVFEQIGLLDETFFLYFEEEEFTLRAHRAGWRSYYVSGSRVVHLVGQATGATGSQRLAKRMPRYWFDSRRYFWTKSYGRPTRIAADIAFLSGHTLWQIRRVLQRKPHVDPPGFMLDFIRSALRPAGKGVVPDASREET